MSPVLEFIVRSVAIGAGATLVMDLWAQLLKQFGIRPLNFAFLGRWLGHLAEGRWTHDDIAASPPVRGERALGWLAHYSIGVTFAALLVALFGLSWARSPRFGPALFIGAVTVVAPWFVLQPALGLGVMSRRTAAPLFNSLKSLVTHIVFGAGLYVAALLTSVVIPVG